MIIKGEIGKDIHVITSQVSNIKRKKQWPHIHDGAVA